MSDPKIGLVAEGKTDYTIISAALKAILDEDFVLVQLHPETSLAFGDAGPHGGGWGGVYRWCRQLVSMPTPIGENASLPGFDLIVLHLDADVAGKKYQDANIGDGPDDLPCQQPCPPVENSVKALRKVLLGWLGLNRDGEPPNKWVLCIPSKCVEAWAVVALYDKSDPIMKEIECNFGLEDWLSRRPKKERSLVRGGKKTKRL